MFPRLTLRVDLNPLDRKLARASREIDEAMAGALEDAGVRVAADAQASHTYVDRTGTLTASMAGLPASGSFLRGTLEAGVIDHADYASYVEEGTDYMAARPFFGPAFDRLASEIDAICDDVLEAAVQNAGLHR